MSIYSRNSVQARGSVAIEAVAGLTGVGHPRIALPGGKFALVDPIGGRTAWPYTTLPIVVIDVASHVSKIYWGPGSFGEAAPPVCFSDNGVAASFRSNEVQARTCAECPHNVFGTSTRPDGTPSKGKACQDRKKLACLVLGAPAGTVYEFSVPPDSLDVWRAYVHEVANRTVPDGSRPAEVYDLVTHVGFDIENQKNPFRLTFSPAQWLEHVGLSATGKTLVPYDEPAEDGGEAIIRTIDGLWSSRRAIDEVLGNNDRPWNAGETIAVEPPVAAPVIEAPKPVQAAPAPQPAPQTAPKPAPAPQPRPANPYAGPPGRAPATPVEAFPTGKRGGARPGAGRPRKDDPRSIEGQPRQAPFADGLARHGMADLPPPNQEIEDAIAQAMQLPTG